jgi:hypothetical protein
MEYLGGTPELVGAHRVVVIADARKMRRDSDAVSSSHHRYSSTHRRAADMAL